MIPLSCRSSPSNVASLRLPHEACILAMLRLIVSRVHSSTGVPHDNLSSDMPCLVQALTRVLGHICRCTTLPVNVDTCTGYWRSSSQLFFLRTNNCGDLGVNDCMTEQGLMADSTCNDLNNKWLHYFHCTKTKLMFNYMCMCSSMNNHPRTTCCSTYCIIVHEHYMKSVVLYNPWVLHNCCIILYSVHGIYICVV